MISFQKKFHCITVFLALFMTIGMSAGCRQIVTSTIPTTMEQTVTPTASSSETSKESTALTETTAGVTTSSAISGTTAATTGTTAETSVISFHTDGYWILHADQVHRIDLNDDGKKESISYSLSDNSNFILTVNGVNLSQSIDSPEDEWFFLVDLDTDDPYLDIAVQEYGPSNDEGVKFFYYDGSRLVFRGETEGMICETYGASENEPPAVPGNIQLDGQGGLITRTRGDILHTWFYEDPWEIGEDQLLHRVPQPYYSMQDDKVTMLMDLPLFNQPGSSEFSAIAKIGQTAELVKTDNKEWVQIRTQSGVLGWFRLQNLDDIYISGKYYSGGAVFDGLCNAD